MCYLRSDWSGAIEASRRVLALTPTHFGALAGLGHCYAHQGNFAAAVESYERALSINPRLLDLKRACARLRTRMESATPPDSCSGSGVA